MAFVMKIPNPYGKLLYYSNTNHTNRDLFVAIRAFVSPSPERPRCHNSNTHEISTFWRGERFPRGYP